MQITLEVERATVIARRYGTDKVFLYTSLPGPYFGDGDTCLSVSFDTTIGQGAEYVSRHFPDLPCEVIQERKS